MEFCHLRGKEGEVLSKIYQNFTKMRFTLLPFCTVAAFLVLLG